jgi:hypothetical protein
MRVERLTSQGELSKFLQLFGEDDLPDDNVTIRAVYDGEELLGCVMSETVEHIGPFYVRPELLNGHTGALLIRTAIKGAGNREIHVVAMNEKSAEMCEKLGLKKVEGTLYIRERNG